MLFNILSSPLSKDKNVLNRLQNFFTFTMFYFYILFYLLHDSLFVVVTKRPAEFVIIHGWPVLLYPPSTCHLNKAKTNSDKQSENRNAKVKTFIDVDS